MTNWQANLFLGIPALLMIAIAVRHLLRGEYWYAAVALFVAAVWCVLLVLAWALTGTT
jgi:hypothetical protein